MWPFIRRVVESDSKLCFLHHELTVANVGYLSGQSLLLLAWLSFSGTGPAVAPSCGSLNTVAELCRTHSRAWREVLLLSANRSAPNYRDANSKTSKPKQSYVKADPHARNGYWLEEPGGSATVRRRESCADAEGRSSEKRCCKIAWTVTSDCRLPDSASRARWGAPEATSWVKSLWSSCELLREKK